MTPIVSAQNCLCCNNGLTNYLYVGVVLNLTNRGPKQVIALPFNSPEYPNVFTHPLFVFSSLSLSLSLSCPTPSTLTSTSFYSPPLVGWLSFLSPLIHTFLCPPEFQEILTNSENSLGTCSRLRTVFGSGFLSESLALGDRPRWDFTQISFVVSSNHQPLRNLLGCSRPNSCHSARDRVHCDEARGYLPHMYRAHIT